MFKKIYNVVLYSFAIIGAVLILGFVSSKAGLTDKIGITDEKTDYFNKSRNLIANENYHWLNTEEYLALKEAMREERVILERIEKEIGIKPRLLISILFVEQMRLYTSDRELFKKVFEPLKLLGIQSQFSWGILGLKQETLIQIEKNLKNINSPFYLGLNFENILDNEQKSLPTDEERFIRVTNEHNPYYTYLYTALFLKQIQKQWQNAGFDISDKPEILATLYNIGFANSKPKSEPQAGGAEIEIANIKYSFGGLAYEFYYSNELILEFPR